jgi:hypothetical protein
MLDEATYYRRRPLRRFLRNWLERHQHPFNFGIHLIGIPLALAGLALFFFAPWPWALAALIGGYVLQWLGHLIEGNDMGEWAGIKRMLGLPYVAIAPKRDAASSLPISRRPPEESAESEESIRPANFS